MNLAKIACASVLLVGSAAVGRTSAGDAASVRGVLTRTLPVAADSAEQGALRQFINTHGDNMPHAKAGGATIEVPTPASFELTRVYEVSGDDALSRTDGRTVGAMLAGGHAGDTVQIATCNGHDSQRWSYAWSRDDWTQRAYDYRRVDACPGTTARN